MMLIVLTMIFAMTLTSLSACGVLQKNSDKTEGSAHPEEKIKLVISIKEDRLGDVQDIAFAIGKERISVLYIAPDTYPIKEDAGADASESAMLSKIENCNIFLHDWMLGQNRIPIIPEEYWNKLLLCYEDEQSLAEALHKKLCEIDPSHKSYYDENLELFEG